MEMNNNLAERIDKINADYNYILGRKKEMSKNINDMKTRLEELDNRIVVFERTNTLINEVAKVTQDKLRFHINNLVTTALRAVFGDGISFKLDIVSRRNGVEADLVVEDFDGNTMSPMDARGGGVVDIVSFALRVGLWGLSQTISPVMELDEPFRNLSEDLLDKAEEFMETLSEETGIQFVIVTHESPLMIGNVFKCTKKNGVTEIKEKDQEDGYNRYSKTG